MFLFLLLLLFSCRPLSDNGDLQIGAREYDFSNLVLMFAIITFHTNLVRLQFATGRQREEWGLWERKWIEIQKSYYSDLKVPIE